MKIPSLKIGDLTIRIPIVQGGMGVSVSKSSLASAVSLAGGLGVIASVGLGEEMDTSIPYMQRSRQALSAEIRLVKQLGLPVGVNVMVGVGVRDGILDVGIGRRYSPAITAGVLKASSFGPIQPTARLSPPDPSFPRAEI